MLDSDFDPYEELMITRHNIGELIKGLNHQSTLFRQLSDQHIQLVELTKQLSQRIESLESEIKALKSPV
jgi:hypothetical protein